MTKRESEKERLYKVALERFLSLSISFSSAILSINVVKRQGVEKCTRLCLQEGKNKGIGSVTDLMALDEWDTTTLNNAGYSHLNFI